MAKLQAQEKQLAEATAAAAKARDLEKQLTQATTRTGNLEKQLADERAQTAALEADKAAGAKAAGKAGAPDAKELAVLRESLAVKEKALAESAQQAAQLKTDAGKSAARVAELEKDLKAQNSSAEARIRDLERKLTAEDEQARKQAQAEQTRANARIQDLEKQLAQARSQTAAATDQGEKSAAQVADLTRQLQQEQSRVKALEQRQVKPTKAAPEEAASGPTAQENEQLQARIRQLEEAVAAEQAKVAEAVREPPAAPETPAVEADSSDNPGATLVQAQEQIAQLKTAVLEAQKLQSSIAQDAAECRAKSLRKEVQILELSERIKELEKAVKADGPAAAEAAPVQP